MYVYALVVLFEGGRCWTNVKAFGGNSIPPEVGVLSGRSSSFARQSSWFSVIKRTDVQFTVTDTTATLGGRLH